MKKKCVCKKCKKTYTLGYNGIGEGCDKCCGIERDRHGFAWKPGQLIRETADGNTITRQQAFAG